MSAPDPFAVHRTAHRLMHDLDRTAADLPTPAGGWAGLADADACRTWLREHGARLPGDDAGALDGDALHPVADHLALLLRWHRIGPEKEGKPLADPLAPDDHGGPELREPGREAMLECMLLLRLRLGRMAEDAGVRVPDEDLGLMTRVQGWKERTTAACVVWVEDALLAPPERPRVRALHALWREFPHDQRGVLTPEAHADRRRRLREFLAATYS